MEMEEMEEDVVHEKKKKRKSAGLRCVTICWLSVVECSKLNTKYFLKNIHIKRESHLVYILSIEARYEMNFVHV